MEVKSADARQDATNCSWLCGNCPLSEGSPLTFPHLWRPNLNPFKQANMYLCGVLCSYDFKSHDQYHNGRILNCHGERRDLSCELPHFYANVDFGSPPLARELWRKKKKAKNKTAGPSFSEFTCSRAQKDFCGKEANCHLPFSFRGKLWHGTTGRALWRVRYLWWGWNNFVFCS